MNLIKKKSKPDQQGSDRVMSYKEFLKHVSKSGMEIAREKLLDAIKKTSAKAFPCVATEQKYIIVKIPFTQVV